MSGRIIASCGHECAKTIPVRYHSEECTVEGFVPCVVFAEYCAPCADAASLWPEFITLPTEPRKDRP